MKALYRDALGADTIPSEFWSGSDRAMVLARTRGAGWRVTGGTMLLALLLWIGGGFLGSETAATSRDPGSIPLTEKANLDMASQFVVTEDDTVPLQDPRTGIVTQVSSQQLDPQALDPTPTVKAAENRLFEDLSTPDIVPPESTESAEIGRLLQLPNASLRFDNEPLAIAIGIIADSSSMSYTISDDLEGVVNGALVGNPYQLLQNLSKAYDFRLEYSNGLWVIRSTMPNTSKVITEPIESRTYAIDNNMLERLTAQDAGGATGESAGSASGSGNSGGIASGNLLTGRTIFKAHYERIREDLHLLLASARPSKNDRKPAVFLNEDGNSLLVAGTAREHELVEDYLKNFDKPQRAIALEVKLIRTKRNPSSLVGVDWSNGIALNLSGTFDEGKVTLDQLVGGLGGSPAGVLLTNSQAKVTLDAIKNDSLTKRISYIEKMTLDNREVVLSNVVEEPVIGDREEIDSDSGLRVLLTIEKEIIGTVLNILPRILRDDSVKMRLRLEDSNIVRFKQFFEGSSGGEYPVISKQTYEGPVVIKDGYSLAITGFETTEEILTKKRIPFLGDVPLIGRAFGSEKTQEERSYLMVFITPRILPDSMSGIDYVQRAHHLGREEPLGPIGGTQFDNFYDLETYVSGIRHQHNQLMQHTDLKGVTQYAIDEAMFLHGELEALQAAAREFVNHGVELRKAKAMVSYCQKALSQTWRISQQKSVVAVSPLDFVQDSGVEPNSVFQSSREARAITTKQSNKSRWFRNRPKGPRKGH